MKSLHGGYVIAPGMNVLKDHAVVFEASQIIDVLPIKASQVQYPNAEVIDRRNSVVSPGFVNAHMHCYGVLSHGIVPPVKILSFESFLEDYWWPLVENLLTADDIEAAAAYASLELADSGVTSLCDVLEAPMAEGGLSAEAYVLEKSGLRAAVSTEACERISYEAGLRLLEENVETARLFRDHPRISAMMCIHTAFTCSQGFLQKAKQMAEDAGISLQLHLNESSYEPQWCERNYGKRTCEWYDDFLFLDASILAAQGVQVSAREIEILRDRGVRMVHVPLSNCEVGGGVAPVVELLNSGITCGLGTDGYINNFFEVMRGAFLIHKGHRADPSVMPAQKVWALATEGGAQAVFPGMKTGLLCPEAKADITVIDFTGLPTPLTQENIFDQLVLFCNPSDVSDVFADGKRLKHEGALMRGDLRDAKKRVCRAAEDLWERGKRLAAR